MFKVLVVDDDNNVRNGLKVLVPWEKYGFEIIDSAMDGKDALEKYRLQSYDLIVVDIQMPRMDGLELISAVRGMYPLVHFLVLTGHAEFEYAKKAIEWKVDGYILKPIDEDELIDNLKKIGAAIKKEQEESLFTAGDYTWQCDDGNNEALVKKMRDIVERNCNQKLTLETLADVFNYSSGYLGKLFKKYTGESFNTYVDKTRVLKAKELLQKGMKVYQVASRLGYSNVDYFHSKFRKYAGISPSDFRKGKTAE